MPVPCQIDPSSLRGLFLLRLPANLPMGKGIAVAAMRTFPGALDRIGIAFMDHRNDEMALQALCWFAVNVVYRGCFAHGFDLSLPATLAILSPERFWR